MPDQQSITRNLFTPKIVFRHYFQLTCFLSRNIEGMTKRTILFNYICLYKHVYHEQKNKQIYLAIGFFCSSSTLLTIPVEIDVQA